MNKIDFMVKVARNIFASGIPARESFILCAVAKLQAGGKKEVTSHEVTELIGDNHVSGTMKRMTWWLDMREGRNSRNKKTYYYTLSKKGIDKLEDIIS
jgi:hypothetical protein